MKHQLIIFLAITLILAGVGNAQAEKNVSYGLGVGSLYNGLGVNVALLSESDLRYASIGCLSAGYSQDSGTQSECGIGVGIIRTDIIGKRNNKHGLGIYLGVNRENSDNSDETFPTLGIGYTFFKNEIQGRGWNFGLTPGVNFKDSTNETVILLNIGYQF